MDWEEINAREIPKVPGTCYLLDVSQGDERPQSEFGEDLLQDSDYNRYDGVFLIVTTTPEVWDECRTTTLGVTRQVSAPVSREVAERRLQEFAVDGRDAGWLSDERFTLLVNRIVKPSDAVALVNSIFDSSRYADIEEAKHAVLDEFQSWRAYLSKWFSDHESVAERAAMIAAAVLDPGTPAEILAARNALLRKIGESEESVGPLSGPGRTGYLKLLDAANLGTSISISAARHNLDEAVVLFVWDEFPQVHVVFQDWLIGLASSASPVVVRRLAEITVKTAIRAKSTIFLQLVRKIVLERPESNSLGLAIIDETVLNSTLGPLVRQRLLQWAKGANELLSVFAVEACGGLLAQEMPRLALKRIFAALSREQSDKGLRAAEDALLKIASASPTREVTRDTVAGWIEADPSAGVRAFLMLNSRAPSFVAASLQQGTAELNERFFHLGWSSALRVRQKDGAVVGAMRNFLDVCRDSDVPPVVVTRIIGPILADSLHSSLAMAVLRAQSGGETNRASDPVRDYLTKELIYGDLAASAQSTAGEAVPNE
ncbi:hypothetical protein ABZ403_21850 [Micromonospora zamorensis]|uniref:hypothetical protein n=1 Tax=Micromonospora zamorensis TaxID=709883 RepID=UPI00340DA005